MSFKAEGTPSKVVRTTDQDWFPNHSCPNNVDCGEKGMRECENARLRSRSSDAAIDRPRVLFAIDGGRFRGPIATYEHEVWALVAPTFRIILVLPIGKPNHRTAPRTRQNNRTERLHANIP